MKCPACGERMYRLERHIFDPRFLVWACPKGDGLYGKMPKAKR